MKSKIVLIFIILALIVGIGKFVFFNNENEDIKDKPDKIITEEVSIDKVIIKDNKIENEELID